MSSLLQSCPVDQGAKLGMSVNGVLKSDPTWKVEGGKMTEDTFLPDRWLTEEWKKKGGLQPFGGGPRMCLGYNLALAEMKVKMSWIHTSFHIYIPGVLCFVELQVNVDSEKPAGVPLFLTGILPGSALTGLYLLGNRSWKGFTICL